jgi:glycosyltransferase involved in cell wall biosynthesis
VRLVALVESEGHVCCRYRLAALRPLLAAAGHSLDLYPLPRSWFGRLSLGRGLETADAVILQRRLLSPLVIARLRRRVRRLIFDFDDALWLRDSYSAKGFDDARRLRRFQAIVAASDLVIAGNDYLATAARRFTTPDRVRVIPTCVEVRRYRPREDEAPAELHTPTARQEPRPPERGLQLVWVGSSSTLKGLEQFAPTLSIIGRAVPGTRLKIICDRFVDIPYLPVDRCVWDERTEAAEIAAADVGIGWVPDDPWSRGKCGLKILQYQAAGLPVVANPVGVQAELVRNNATGLLASNTDDWLTAIRRLAAEPGLRHRLGATGRKQVEEKYSLAAAARLWIEALDRFALLRKAG